MMAIKLIMNAQNARHMKNNGGKRKENIAFINFVCYNGLVFLLMWLLDDKTNRTL